MVRIDHSDLGEYLEFAQSSEAARSLIDKTSDVYYDYAENPSDDDEDIPFVRFHRR